MVSIIIAFYTYQMVSNYIYRESIMVDKRGESNLLFLTSNQYPGKKIKYEIYLNERKIAVIKQNYQQAENTHFRLPIGVHTISVKVDDQEMSKLVTIKSNDILMVVLQYWGNKENPLEFRTLYDSEF
jgi:hypothetical protein